MRSMAKKTTLTMAGLLTGAVLLAACGATDRPEYCDRVDTLQDSISQLTDIQIDPGIIDSVKADLNTVESDAQAAVDAAREDFPDETDALENSINEVSTSVNDLPDSPSAAQVAVVAVQVSAVVNAAQDFRDATTSACE